MKRIYGWLQYMNVAKHISHHLVGEDHTDTHRKIAGGVIMLFGVGLVKSSLLIDSHILHYLSDVVGFGFHGIGLIPFISGMEKKEGVHEQTSE